VIVTRLSTAPGGDPQPLGAQLLLTPTGEPTRRVYRRVLYLRLSTGGMAESLEILDEAILRAHFVRHDYDAVTVGEPALRATRTAGPGGVLVTLDAPRRVLAVTLSGAKSAFGQTLDLYRLDGDTPATEPSLSATRSAPILQQHVEAVVGLTDGGGAFPIAAAAGGIGWAGHAEAGGAAAPGRVEVGVAHHLLAAAVGPFPVDITDRRFLLRLRSATGAAVPLAPGDIAGIVIRSYPRNPRVGLALPSDPAAPTAVDPSVAAFFWRGEGEVGNGAPETAGVVDAGVDLGRELARGVRRLVSLMGDIASPTPAPPTLPSLLDAALVIESDAPCAFEPRPAADAPALRVGYRLARRSFPDGEEKRVLRFAAGRVAAAQVDLQLPTGGELLAATVDVDLSLRHDGPAEGGLPEAGLAGDAGIRLTETRWAAQPLALPRARTASAVAVGVMALERDGELSLELRADADGTPRGTVLARGTLTPGSPGRRHWAVLRLAEPVVVSTAPHWLVLGATSGAVLWLTGSGGTGARSYRRGTDARLVEPSHLDGLEARHALLSPGGPPARALAVYVGAHAVEPPPLVAGRVTLDLTDAMTAALADAAQAATVALRFEAMGPGIITVYPPALTYDLP
jgi:hypothetical protein